MDRQQQVQSLIRRVQALSARRAGFAVALCGPPGIGKSHAARSVAAALPQGVIRVRAAAPGAELARAWRSGSPLPGWVERILSQLEGGQPVPNPDLLRAFCAALSAQVPRLLLLEDLHDCAPERRSLWTELARAARSSRGTALLWTSRGEVAELEQIWLEPLNEHELAALLEGESLVPLPTEVRRWLASRSGGNPLFALEFVRDLRRRGELWLDVDTWRWRGTQGFAPTQAALPSSIEALIEQGLDRLSPGATRLLEVRTLLHDAPGELETLWAPLSGLAEPAFSAAHLELEQAGALRAGDWSHPLFLEVAQARLDPDTRRRDAAAATELVAEDDPQRAAGWVEQAGLSGAAAAAHYDRAAYASASPQAACGWARLALQHHPRKERVERALALLGTLGGSHFGQEAEVLDLALSVEPAHLELVSRRARLWARQGQPQKAKPLLEALNRRDPAWQLEWLKLLFTLGESTAAFALWDGAPDVRGAVNGRWASSMVGMLAYQERFEEGLALADHWLSQPGVNTLDLARLHNARGVLYQTWEQPEQALGEYQQALALCRGAGPTDTVRLAQGNAAMIHNRREEFTQAETLFAQAAQAMLEAGDLTGYASTQAVRAANRSDQGHFEHAEALLLEAHAILSPGGASVEGLECEIYLARMYALWGRPLHAALSLRHAHRALEGARRQGGRHMLRRALEGAALCEARVGDPQRALTLLGGDLSELGPEVQQSPESQLSRALALERLGQGAEARASLEAVCAENADDELLALELDRLRGDEAAARLRSARFEARGHGLGVHLGRQYFPVINLDVPTASPQSGDWRLEVLGPFRLRHQGESRPLRGERRRRLLTLLLEARLAGQPEVSSGELTGALYPAIGAHEARAALRQLFFQVRDALAPEVVLTTAQGYALGNVGSDAEDFLGSSDTRLWRGAYPDALPGTGLQGGGSVGEGLAEGLCRAGLAWLEASGPGPSRQAAQEAARVARLLLAMDPYATDALALGLRAFRHLGHYTAVRRLYEQARLDWQEVGEALPAHWAEFLTLRETHQVLSFPETAREVG
jgi:tetratricopeptide (TPR) repeat protein